MAAKSKTETRGFETEAKQLLHLMINSLYSNKEIFLRELISNASDAVDKLRFETLSNPALLEEDVELKVQIDIDEKKRTIEGVLHSLARNREKLEIGRFSEPPLDHIEEILNKYEDL